MRVIYGRKRGPIALGGILLVALLGSVAIAHAISTSAGAPFSGTVAVGKDPVGLLIDDQSGHTFVANATDTSVSVLDTVHGTVLSTVALDGQPGAMAVDDRTGRAFVITAPPTGPESVSMLDSHTGVLLRTVAVGRATSAQGGALAVDERRGRVVVTNAGESSVSVLDARGGAPRRAFPAGLDPTGVAIDPRTGHAYVADSSQNRVLVLDVARGRVLRTFPVGGQPYAVRIDTATGRLYATGYDTNTGSASVTVLDSHSGRRITGAAGAKSVIAEDIMADPRSGALYTVDYGLHSIFVTSRQSRVARRIMSWSGLTYPASAAWPHAVTIDPRGGRLLLLLAPCNGKGIPTPTAAGCVGVVDTHAGRLLCTVDVGRGPSALALDARTERVFVANSRGGSDAHLTGWLPAWLRSRLPWLAPSGASGASATTGTVSVFEESC